LILYEKINNSGFLIGYYTSNPKNTRIYKILGTITVLIQSISLLFYIISLQFYIEHYEKWLNMTNDGFSIHAIDRENNIHTVRFSSKTLYYIGYLCFFFIKTNIVCCAQ